MNFFEEWLTFPVLDEVGMSAEHQKTLVTTFASVVFDDFNTTK